MSAMHGFWYSLDGKKLKKLERWELAEAKRLWARHADIRIAGGAGSPPPITETATRREGG